MNITNSILVLPLLLSLSALAGNGHVIHSQPVNHTIYFDSNSSQLKKKWNDLITAHADFIKENDIKVLVAGFTDKQGGDEYNHWLGEQRAKKVCKALLEQGVLKDSLSCFSYGENHLADTGDSADANARNRRIKFVY